MTFGRVGNWYIVCTNEELFKQCIAAEPNAFAAPRRRDGMTPMARIHLKAHKLAGPLARIGDHLEAHPLPGMHQEQLDGLEALSRILRHINLVNAEFYRGPDDTIVGQMEIKRTN